MPLVDFDKIEVDSDIEKIPVIGFTSGTNTVNIYDSDWGYVKFGQSVIFKYTNSKTYQTKVVFNINGIFTVGASYASSNGTPSPPVPSGTTETQRFDKLKSKYLSLLSKITASVKASPPSSISNYGTSSDSRCIQLPGILLDSSGNKVYAKVSSFNIEETQWPNYIKYTATLEEVIKPTCKILVEGTMVDNPVLTITAKKPRLKFVNFAFANSSDIYFAGWNPRGVALSADIPEVSPSGVLGNDAIKSLLNNLSDGKVTIKKKLKDGSTSNVFEDLYLDNSSLELSSKDDGSGTRVSFSARY